jgi:hypothetical protein
MAKSKLKTQVTQASSKQFLAQIKDKQKQADAQELVKIMQEATGEEPVMWGSAIVGFGKSQIKYADGRVLDWFPVGFSPRKQYFALYGLQPKKQGALLKKLGKHKIGGGCLYINSVADVDKKVLKQLIEARLE